MNNPNPFLPQGAFLEQKNKARTRFKIAVSVSISVSVVVLMVLLIQGCKKPNDGVETASTSNPETNTTAMPSLPSNPPDMGAMSNTTPAPETNTAVYTPPPPPPAPPAPPVAATEDYTIVKGDLLANIAKEKRVSVPALMNANPGLDPKKLKIGQKIHIPAAATSSSTAITPTPGNTVGGTEVGNGMTYKVKSGDTLTGIAKRFHVTIKSIQSANSLSSTRLNVGQTLKIPGGTAPAPAPAPTPAPVESQPSPSLSAPTSAPAPTTLPPPTASHVPRT